MGSSAPRTVGWCLCSVALWLAVVTSSSSPSAAPAQTWVIDPARTHIAFAIDATGYPRTQGEFHRFVGQLSVNFDHPDQSRVRFQVEAQSADAGSSGLSDYLRGEALLNAFRFKDIVFSSSTVTKIDERTVVVAGELTMLGVTRPLTVDVTVSPLPGRLHARFGFVARAKIDRLDYGMNSGFPLVSRTVDLTVSSEAAEQ